MLPVDSQIVHVNYLFGNDMTGDGAEATPFQTIVAAVASVTDATVNKPYAIQLQAGKQIETSQIFLKPYISIIGYGQRVTTIDLSGLDIKPDSSASTVDCICTIQNLTLGGAGIDWDLQALGGTFVAGGILVSNVQIDGFLNINGRNNGGTGDFVECYNTIVYNSTNIDSSYFLCSNSENANTVSITNAQSATNFIKISNSVFDANLTIDSNNVIMNNLSYGNGAVLTTVGTLTLTSFRGLPAVGQRSLSGGTTVVNVD